MTKVYAVAIVTFIPFTFIIAVSSADGPACVQAGSKSYYDSAHAVRSGVEQPVHAGGSYEAWGLQRLVAVDSYILVSPTGVSCQGGGLRSAYFRPPTL
jgi:hypothetical protein